LKEIDQAQLLERAHPVALASAAYINFSGEMGLPQELAEATGPATLTFLEEMRPRDALERLALSQLLLVHGRVAWLSKRLAKVAHSGRTAAQSAEAQASRAVTQRRNALAQNAWKKSDLPTWLDEKVYAEQIQPRLPEITSSALSSALGVSRQYAINIRAGRRRPHPRHWENLAQLVGVLSNR
jgi:hypothetical protein